MGSENRGIGNEGLWVVGCGLRIAKGGKRMGDCELRIASRLIRYDAWLVVVAQTRLTRTPSDGFALGVSAFLRWASGVWTLAVGCAGPPSKW